MKKKTFFSVILILMLISCVFTEVLAGCSDYSHHCGGNDGDHSTGWTCSHTSFGGWECYTCAETTVSGTKGWETKYCTRCGNRKPKTTREHSYGSSCYECGASGVRCSQCGHCKIHSCDTRTDATNPTLSAYSGTYDGNSHTIGVSGGYGGTIKYSTDGSSWSTTKPTRTAAGTTTVYVYVEGDSSHYSTSSISSTITINKANSTNPSISGYSGTYDGRSHTINVSGGSGGTIQYSTNGSSWSTTKPTRTAAGTTTVYVRVAGDSNHNTTSTISANISISKANSSNPSISGYSGTYDGNSHTISVSGGSGGTIQYSTDNSNWSTTKPTRTAAGTTIVYVRVVGDANHNNTSSISANITISKANSTNPTLTSVSKTYDGSALPITSTGGNGGTIYYKTSEDNITWSSWTTTKPSRTDAGITYVKAYVAGDSNHNSTSETDSYTITINQANGSNPTLTEYSAQYDGAAHTIGESGGAGGTIKYSTDNVNWSTTKPTITNVGSITIYVKRDESKNYKATSETSAKVTITQREVEVEWESSTTFIYNGSAQKPKANVTSPVSGQTLIISNTHGIDAGTYTSVATLDSVTGGSTSNYKLIGTTKDFTINKKSVAITWGTATFIYNGQEQGPTANAVGVSGETINITPSKEIDAGTSYIATITFDSVTGGRANKENYTLTNITKPFVINPKEVSTIWGEQKEFIYNGQEQAPTARAESEVTGETLVVYRTSEIDAGTYISEASITSVTGGQAKVENYTLTNTTQQFKINPKEVSTIWGEQKEFIYNGQEQAPTARAESEVTGETLIVDRTKGIDAGTYISEASITSVIGGQAKVENYTLINTTQPFTINKKDLNVKADDKTKIYGDVNPELTVTIEPTGIGSEVGSVSGALTTAATQFSNIGPYDINKGTIEFADNLTFKAANYNMIFTKGTMTINPATPVVRLTNKHVVYDLQRHTIDAPVPTAVPLGTSPSSLAAPVITGVPGGTVPHGTVTYEYYTDEECTIETTAENAGAAFAFGPPSEAGYSDEDGTYFVKATIAAEGNYAASTSEPAILFIERAPMSGYVSIGGENAKGYKLTVDTRAISPLETIRTYKFYVTDNADGTGGTLAMDMGEDNSYLVREEDSGKYIYVIVTAAKKNYYTTDFSSVMLEKVDNDGPRIGDLVVTNAVGDKLINSETMLEIKDCYDPSGIGEYEWQFKNEGGDWQTIKVIESSESHSELIHQIPKEGAGMYRVIVRDVHGNESISNIVTVYLVFDRKPTITLERNQVGQDEVDINVIVKSVSEITRAAVNKSELSTSGFDVRKDVIEYTTTFVYKALVNGIYTFEVQDSIGNIVQESINISTITKQRATIEYEIINATAVSDAEIRFKANEPVRIMAPSGYGGIIFNTEGFATTIRATIPENFDFGNRRTFRFQNQSYNETEVIVQGPILSSIQYLRFVNPTVDGMSVTLSKAYAMANELSTLQVYVAGQVQSYYGMSMSSALRPKSVLASSEDLDVISVLGNANRVEFLNSKNEVAEVPAVAGISANNDAGYTNGNVTGVKNVSEGTISTYVSGGSIDGSTTYDTFRVKLVP